MAVHTAETNWASRYATNGTGLEEKVAERFAKEALTFDDVLLVPGYAETLPSEVNLSIELHERLRLNIPVISAAMDSPRNGRSE